MKQLFECTIDILGTSVGIKIYEDEESIHLLNPCIFKTKQTYQVCISQGMEL